MDKQCSSPRTKKMSNPKWFYSQCAVPGCNNKGKDITLHKSPKNRERYLKWAEFAERKTTEKLFYICQIHFERKCFSFLGPVPRLLPASIPTLKGTSARKDVCESNVTSNSVTKCVEEDDDIEFPDGGETDDEEEFPPQNPTRQPQLCAPSDKPSALSETLLALHQDVLKNAPKNSVEDEYDKFGKVVACYLKQFPTEIALSCQKRIQDYLVQKFLSFLQNTVGPDLCDEIHSPNLSTLPAPTFNPIQNF